MGAGPGHKGQEEAEAGAPRRGRGHSLVHPSGNCHEWQTDAKQQQYQKSLSSPQTAGLEAHPSWEGGRPHGHPWPHTMSLSPGLCSRPQGTTAWTRTSAPGELGGWAPETVQHFPGGGVKAEGARRAPSLPFRSLRIKALGPVGISADEAARPDALRRCPGDPVLLGREAAPRPGRPREASCWEGKQARGLQGRGTPVRQQVAFLPGVGRPGHRVLSIRGQEPAWILPRSQM